MPNIIIRGRLIEDEVLVIFIDSIVSKMHIQIF